MEHLHRAAGDSVGLAEMQRPRLLLDDPGGDVRKRRQLRRECQTCRPAADDQDVDLRRKMPRRLHAATMLGRFGNLRVARSEPVEMELHGHRPAANVSSNYRMRILWRQTSERTSPSGP